MTNNYPNLFIPGAAKSGTSTLHDLLNIHPDICMSILKEPYFLINDNFDQNINIYNQKYAEFFNLKPNAIYMGESSTAYMLFPNFIERIKKHVKKDMRFIFILRNPIDRLYSHYWYLKGIGSEDSNLYEAIKKDMDISPNMSHRLPEGKFKHYYQYGLYGKWLSRFYDEFTENQIKIIIFEDLKENPLKIVNECFTFLGLKELDNIPKINSNKTTILRLPKIHKTILKIANGNVKFLKPLYLIIPRTLKTVIKKNISKIIIKMTKTDKTYPKLSNEDRLWIKGLYINDYDILKNVTGKTFNQWEDFN